MRLARVRRRAQPLPQCRTPLGVCRDFAHVSIAMLRSISIPARYVVGYLGGLLPQDVHAWGEAYVGNQWVAFDATPGLAPGERIAIAVGRDAAEVAIMDQFGPLPSSSQMAGFGPCPGVRLNVWCAIDPAVVKP